MYRTYDTAWNRTGYSEVPQYPGQADMVKDFPANCGECGAGIVSVAKQLEPAPDLYKATCSNGHEIWPEAIL